MLIFFLFYSFFQNCLSTDTINTKFDIYLCLDIKQDDLPYVYSFMDKLNETPLQTSVYDVELTGIMNFMFKESSQPFVLENCLKQAIVKHLKAKKDKNNESVFIFSFNPEVHEKFLIYEKLSRSDIYPIAVSNLKILDELNIYFLLRDATSSLLTCNAVPIVPHAVYSSLEKCKNTKFFGTCEFECEIGYEPLFNQVRCLRYGIWAPNSCFESFCVNPPYAVQTTGIPQNCAWKRFNDVCELKCDGNQEKVGFDYICMPSSTEKYKLEWIGNAVCKSTDIATEENEIEENKDCPANFYFCFAETNELTLYLRNLVEEISELRADLQFTIVSNNITLSEREREIYKLTFQDLRDCLALSKSLMKTKPRREAINVLVFSYGTNIHYMNRFYREVVQGGFIPHGVQDTYTGQRENMQSILNNVCNEKRKCESVPKIENADEGDLLKCKNTVLFSDCYFVCHEGYVGVAKFTRCLKNGKWSSDYVENFCARDDTSSVWYEERSENSENPENSTDPMPVQDEQ